MFGFVKGTIPAPQDGEAYTVDELCGYVHDAGWAVDDLCKDGRAGAPTGGATDSPRQPVYLVDVAAPECIYQSTELFGTATLLREAPSRCRAELNDALRDPKIQQRGGG